MKRKMIWTVFFAAFITVNPVTAQEEKNVISVGIANLGGGIGYERMLGTHISVGIETVGSFAFEINTYDDTSWYSGFVSVEGQVKLYPWQGLFVKLGAGYHWGWLEDNRHGFFVSPGLGWKIDIGRSGGFVLVPAIDVPIFIYKKLDTQFGVGVLAKLAVGYCF